MGQPDTKQYFLIGLIFGTAGLLCGLPVYLISPEGGWWILIPASGLAGFLVSITGWRMMYLVFNKVTFLKSILMGGIIALASHPVAWYLMILTQYLLGSKSTLGYKTMGPVDGLTATINLSMFSLLFAGWFTVAAGCVMGYGGYKVVVE